MISGGARSKEAVPGICSKGGAKMVRVADMRTAVRAVFCIEENEWTASIRSSQKICFEYAMVVSCCCLSSSHENPSMQGMSHMLEASAHRSSAAFQCVAGRAHFLVPL